MSSKTYEIKKRYDYGAFFKYEDLYRELINLLTILPSSQIGNNGIYFQKHPENNTTNLDLTNLNKTHLKNNTHNILKINLFSLKKKRKLNEIGRFNSDIKKNLHLPSLSNSNSNYNKYKLNSSVPKNNLYKLNTESFSFSKTKLFDNDNFCHLKNGNVNKNSINNKMGFLKDRNKYFKFFFDNENDYFKRLEKSKRKKSESKNIKKPCSVIKSFCLSEKSHNLLRKKIQMIKTNS